MRMRLSSCFIISSLVFIGACAGPVPKIDASAARLSEVRTITVIRPPEPKTYVVMNFGHPGLAFGLVGGLVAAGDQSDKQDRLTALYKAQSLAVSSKIADSIAEKLNISGFQAAVEDGPWEDVDGKPRLAFNKIISSADAVMVITPTMEGFVATATEDYMPTITAVVILLGKDHKEQLYKGFHASGWAPRADGWKATPPKKKFSNFDALIGDPKNSSMALLEAATDIAQTVGFDLKH